MREDVLGTPLKETVYIGDALVQVQLRGGNPDPVGLFAIGTEVPLIYEDEVGSAGAHEAAPGYGASGLQFISLGLCDGSLGEV